MSKDAGGGKSKLVEPTVDHRRQLLVLVNMMRSWPTGSIEGWPAGSPAKTVAILHLTDDATLAP